MSENQSGNLFTDWFLLMLHGRTMRGATLSDHNEGRGVTLIAHNEERGAS